MNFKENLLKVAPTIAAAFGTPLAGVATKLLSDILLGREANSPEELHNALLQASPEKIVAIIQADDALKASMIQAVTRGQEIAAADTADARSRDIKIREASGGKNDRQDVMIIGATLGLISCLLSLIFFRGSIPGEAVGIISTIAGIFGACLKDAFQFEFGSSRGSKEANATIAKIAQSD